VLAVSDVRRLPSSSIRLGTMRCGATSYTLVGDCANSMQGCYSEIHIRDLFLEIGLKQDNVLFNELTRS